MGFISDAMQEIIDQMCEEIADDAVNTAIDTMNGMCGNAGQESIIGDCEGDFEDQVDDIADGEWDEVESNHPEAVGEITDTGNQICSAAAAMCKALQEGADAL